MVQDDYTTPPPERTPPRGEAVRHVLRGPDGQYVATHCRIYRHDGSKVVWWEQPDGTKNLGDRKPEDLPLYGVHELEPGTTVVIVVEGEPARDALAPLAKELDIAVVATVTGAGKGQAPGLRALGPLHRANHVVLWPTTTRRGRRTWR